MNNVDIKEIEKFNSLANEWWDKEGSFKTLHQINPLRLNYINNKVSLDGMKVLDIGCGGGILAESMAELGAEVTGIDAGKQVIEIAKSHSDKVNSEVNYINCTCEELLSNGLSNNFDVVTCLEMLEHVPDPSEIVLACSALCKPNGHVFFSTINRNPKSYLFAVLGAEYLLRLLPIGTHDYQKFIKPSELASWIRSSDLYLNELIGLLYNPLTDKYWLDSDTSVNYLVHTTVND